MKLERIRMRKPHTYCGLVLRIQVQHAPTAAENNALTTLRVNAHPENRRYLPPGYVIQFLNERSVVHAPDDNLLVVTFGVELVKIKVQEKL